MNYKHISYVVLAAGLMFFVSAFQDYRKLNYGTEARLYTSLQNHDSFTGRKSNLTSHYDGIGESKNNKMLIGGFLLVSGFLIGAVAQSKQN